MSYAATLAKMIQDSNLTLRQIAEQVKTHGVKVDPSYISKLQSGNQSPASDEINVALAKVCHSDPERLVFEAYLEKAPDVVTDMITKLSTSMRNLWIALNYPGFSKATIQLVNERLLNSSELDMIREFYFSDEALHEYTEKINAEQDRERLEWELQRERLDEEEVEAHLQSQKLFPNTYNVEDDSMSPMIGKGSVVSYFEGLPVNNDDLLLVKLADGTQMVRRYISIGEQVALIADNRKFPPIILNPTEVTIIGRILYYSTYV